LKQEPVSGFYIYVFVTWLRESNNFLVLCFTCKICLQHFRYNDENNKWT